jgi:pimeloyl-ACP methyl ester carboxylesterase
MPRVKANDTELYYQEAGTGPEPLVLVHDWVSSSRIWVETMPRLPLKRYHIHAFDLRGAGQSERPVSGYSPEQYADDIAAAMTALRVETFSFVGHSMGGLTGMQFALRHPRRLRKLALVAPAPSGGLPTPELLLPFMAACRDAARYRTLARLMTSDHPMSEHLLDMIVEDATTCSEGHVEESWRGMRDTSISDRLPEISAPTLMLVGDRDLLRPFNLDDAARIPNCALQVFYRAGHLIPYSVPQAFTNVLVEFLEHGTAAPVKLEKWAAQLQPMAAPATA